MQAAALYQSSIGKKAVMALTGLIWIGFVSFHMYGNLKVFQGAATFNAYAEGLRSLGYPIFGHLHLLMLARIVLIVAIAFHIWSAWSLYLQARHARPANYATRRGVQANYAATTMRWGGVLLVFFLLFHLAQLTWGVQALNADFTRSDPYANLVNAFSFWPTVVLYLLALVTLGFHLFHGTWSMFQTLGWNNRNYDGMIHGAAWAVAIVVPVGFALVPIAVQLGIVA
jgi:succinate dehydrogenase / fumarate reductase cytochrome b subunit